MACSIQSHLSTLALQAHALLPLVYFCSIQTPLHALALRSAWTNLSFPSSVIGDTDCSSVSCRVDQSEDVVEDVVAAVGWEELEGLGVAHGPSLFVDLENDIRHSSFHAIASLTYQECTANNDQNTSRCVAWLRVEC